jgi:predicted metal-dependent phosphoesterase TrpH
MPGPDLHTHSTASDGALAPAGLVARAAGLGLPAIAITDHDTVAGVAAAIAAGAQFGIDVIAGVELSAGMGDESVHILGYFIDHTNADLLERLVELRAIRLERAERIVRALNDGGIGVSIDDVLRIADGGAVGRAHVAQLLVEQGHVGSVPDAFRQLLGSSAPYYVPKPVFSPREVIGWITAANGVAVLAHPGLSRADALIPALVAEGIIGLEAYHGAHDAEQRVHYERLAAAHGLIATGGSDFHGDDHEGGELGSADVPEGSLDALYAAHAGRTARP